MYRRANKTQLCVQTDAVFKIQQLDLAKCDVCVTVNVITLYDKNQTA